MAYGEEIDIRDVIDTLENKMLSASDMNEEKTVNLEELMTQSIDLIDNGYKNGGQLLGETTGYKLLDNAINGFVKGDLCIIAARPSMGKTALSMEMLNKLPPGKKGLIFEMEMSKGKLGIRMLAPRTYINSQDLSKGLIKDTDFSVIQKEAGKMANKNNVFINCRTGLSVSEIKAEAKKIKIQNGLDVIFVDHIGKVRPDNPKATKNDQIGQISEEFKNMAMDLDICCVVLSQLNREVEKRTDKHPIMSDLRNSGCIEQDADEILMLYRDDYYAEREGRKSIRPGLLEVLVAKNKDGNVGAIKLYYNTNYQIISDRPILY
ncbi:DnaB-like helicase C-terminal domain-containing protein [Clostridium algoriphilum]|uniref:replicative DNA helicase n=1 Tax=Clostridium algoriphilum TaxID=198347 RepID=UPI001CF11D5D|nr:DnaB-like helicase C-terminal domain-containing protein [Clostridium algoriphilum]MCB2294677.1 DnaB-like helicase C-terminal domain-containing protein [Clostridium algoriphilum]